MESIEKYSDQVMLWLREMGYSHCFYVAGGNIMHLLHSAGNFMTCIPVIHEVAAGIAVEYYNEMNAEKGDRAFALVTAGPGLTNIVTAIAGAYMESRELLVIGGQVKSSDLSRGEVRQRGIQEIDGVKLVESITKESISIHKPLSKAVMMEFIEIGQTPRKGPVFLEFCLDVQAANPIDEGAPHLKKASLARSRFDPELIQKLKESHRPVILLGGGVSREVAHRLREYLEDSKIPVMTTWNGCDRYSPEHSNYWGRPNTWGQRSANILLQQADYLLAIGTRLGLQQTGFNWEEFVPNGKVVQIDIDKSELDKGHPKLYKALNVDANQFMEWLCREIEGVELDIAEWLEFGNSVRKILPLSEDSNTRIRDFINPYDFMIELSSHLKAEDVIIPSSSGGSETVTMQALLNPSGARVITSKGMASMGYGLSAAIGSAVASQSRVIHIEGDGGFAQNLQELGTVRRQNLPIKTFIFSNEGYASIRMTQKSYFGGQYMGCDIETGLGLPDWESIFKAYGIPCLTLDSKNPFNEEVLSRLASHGPSAFLVIVSPEQTYYPKISSRVTETGSMISNPLHLMYPALDDELSRKVFKYIKA